MDNLMYSVASEDDIVFINFLDCYDQTIFRHHNHLVKFLFS